MLTVGEKIGNCLAEVRLKAKLDAGIVSQRTNLPVDVITAIESGGDGVPVDLVFRLAVFFGVEIEIGEILNEAILKRLNPEDRARLTDPKRNRAA